MAEHSKTALLRELMDAINKRYAPNNHALVLEAALLECADPERLAAKVEEMRRAAA